MVSMIFSWQRSASIQPRTRKEGVRLGVAVDIAFVKTLARMSRTFATQTARAYGSASQR